MKLKEIIIIAVIALAAVLYLVLRPSGRISYDMPDWDKYSKDDVSEISYGPKDSLTVLTTNGDSWILPTQKKITTTKMNRIIESVTALKILDKLSDTDNYKRFQLDEEQGTIVKVTAGDKSQELIFGKGTPNGGGTYVRFPNQKGVFSVSGDFESLFPKDPSDLRDKRVLTFDKSKISSISLMRGEEGIMLNKNDDKWYTDGTEFAESDKLETSLGTLGQLNCTSYLDDTNSGTPTLEVQFEGDGTKSLTVYNETDEGYVASSSDVTDSFVMPKYLVEDLLKLFTK
ncbi:DUF4340 domain-containing protein [Spirochaeta cellobiosiphila]|uniref:DUF4340 domain-containing protein n=1 Tax=Spirochaeta cellobiosiphila TaxID=504483 RepID=UPI000406E1BC|nr:DUF4340 domain-containing protein [Spirochaeta cellobiosiphila]